MSAMNAYLGIDPGQKGGIAIIRPDGAEAWRYPGDIVAAANLLRELHIKHTIKLACIESVHSMPGQGVSSTFKFGQNFGSWLGMLAAFGIPHTTVTPHKWQKTVLDAGTGAGHQSARRLHLRRGHIRHLQSGKTTWVTCCMVGSGGKGFIQKDYSVVRP